MSRHGRLIQAMAAGQNSQRGEIKWESSRQGKELAGGNGSSDEISNRLEQAMNRNAFYHFRTDVQDGVNVGELHREENRNGLQVNGSYSYSDGFVRRTVQYVADEKGYRVLKETVTPMGQGPKENLSGVASIRTEVNGRAHHYSVNASDLIQIN